MRQAANRLRLFWIVLAALCLSGTHPQRAAAQELIVDLSQHLVAITTGFTGAEVLLFGAIDDAEDVLVIVSGPEQPAVIRRKARVAGIWINQDRLEFPQVPAFYQVAGSNALAGADPKEVLRRFRLGTEILEPRPATQAIGPENLQAFREALIRNKQRAGLFAEKVAPVIFIGERLFRTTLNLPANVPTGIYSATVFSIDDGRIVSMTTTPLVVRKAGFGAAVYEFAHDYAAGYGLIAIAVAAMAGWAAGAIFRRA